MDCRETIDELLAQVPSKPAKLDTKLFVTTVHAICQGATTTDGEIWPVRGLLRYLLLRRDPTTDARFELDFKEDIRGGFSERFEHLREASYDALERRLGMTDSAKPFPILQWIWDLGDGAGSRWSTLEETTLLPLFLWAFTGNMRTNTILTKRACLRIYKRHLSTSIGDVNSEFLQDKLDITRWYSNLLRQLLDTNLTTDKVVEEMNYAGIFVSLVRAVRMKLFQEVDIDLKSEVAWLIAETMSN